VYDVRQLFFILASLQDRLTVSMNRQVRYRKELAKQYELQLKYLSPANKLREKRTLLMNLEEQMEFAMKRQIIMKRHEMAIYIERLKGLSPLQKLNSGFSYVMDEAGKSVRSVSAVESGDQIKIYVTDGYIKAVVQEIQEEKRV